MKERKRRQQDKAVEDRKSSKTRWIGWDVGKGMRKTKGEERKKGNERDTNRQ